MLTEGLTKRGLLLEIRGWRGAMLRPVIEDQDLPIEIVRGEKTGNLRDSGGRSLEVLVSEGEEEEEVRPGHRCGLGEGREIPIDTVHLVILIEIILIVGKDQGLLFWVNATKGEMMTEDQDLPLIAPVGTGIM